MAATTGTFSAGISATSGTFSAGINATTGTFSAGISATTGTFSAGISATTGTFTDTVAAPQISIASAMSISVNPSERAFQFDSGGHRWSYSISTGDVSLIQGGSGTILAVIRNSGNFQIYGQGYKPGGGSWQDSSDARIKDVIGEYAVGLSAVNALNPIRYTFKGNDGRHVANGKEYIGLVAQDMEIVMPEMITLESGTVDGNPVDDMRILNSSSLVYALVNSVKELARRIEDLEAKLALRANPKNV